MGISILVLALMWAFIVATVAATVAAVTKAKTPWLEGHTPRLGGVLVVAPVVVKAAPVALVAKAAKAAKALVVAVAWALRALEAGHNALILRALKPGEALRWRGQEIRVWAKALPVSPWEVATVAALAVLAWATSSPEVLMMGVVGPIPAKRILETFNATLHPQSEQMVEFLKENGYQIINDEPGGALVDPMATMEEVRAIADRIVQRQATGEWYADAILIGGLSSLQIAIYEAAIEANLEVIEVGTERVRDAQDRFVFNAVALRVIRKKEEVGDVVVWDDGEY